MIIIETYVYMYVCMYLFHFKYSNKVIYNKYNMSFVMTMKKKYRFAILKLHDKLEMTMLNVMTMIYNNKKYYDM